MTIILTLERAKSLLLGYWLAALLAIVTWGLVLVFAISASSPAKHTAKHTVNPIIDITLGALLLVIAFVIVTDRDGIRARKERRREKAREKPPPRWERTLSKGSARATFVIGILMSFPGASFIAGMDKLSKQKIGTTATVLAIIAFGLIELVLLEVPLIGFTIRPDWTEAAVARFKDWLIRRGGLVAVILAFVLGALLIIRGIANLN